MGDVIIEREDFEGDNVCEKCPRLNEDELCKSYSPEGMAFRQKMGYCPISERWASWREDKPKDIKVKKHVGQGKTRSGGNL